MDATIKELGDTLDHLEFVEQVSELQRENATTVHRQIGRYAVPPQQPDYFDLCFELPEHPAVSAYRTALMFTDDDLPKIALQGARAYFRACGTDYNNRCHYRLYRDAEWSDGGKFVSLRAILDAEHAMVAAYASMKEVRERMGFKVVRLEPRRKPAIRSVPWAKS